MNRRHFLASLAASGATCLQPAEATAQTKLWPKSANLEHGDLIWTRRKDLWIPFNVPLPIEIRQNIEEELGHTKGRWSPEMISQIMPQDKKIRKKGIVIESAQNYISVGHVAIVKKTRGRIEIIEAAGEDPQAPNEIREHITKLSLAKWLKSCQPEDQFWIGNFSKFAGSDIDKIVAVAEAQVGKKKYDLWNFNLADASAFYCSKLIWYAVHSAKNISLDDHPNPVRSSWYSPKMMIKSPYIHVRLGNPAEY